MKEVKKTGGGNKTTFKVYMQNYWQLYLMLVIPVIYMILLRYKPMLGAIIAFKKFNIFAGIWDSPWIGLAHPKETEIIHPCQRL